MSEDIPSTNTNVPPESPIDMEETPSTPSVPVPENRAPPPGTLPDDVPMTIIGTNPKFDQETGATPDDTEKIPNTEEDTSNYTIWTFNQLLAELKSINQNRNRIFTQIVPDEAWQPFDFLTLPASASELVPIFQTILSPIPWTFPPTSEAKDKPNPDLEYTVNTVKAYEESKANLVRILGESGYWAQDFVDQFVEKYIEGAGKVTDVLARLEALEKRRRRIVDHIVDADRG